MKFVLQNNINISTYKRSMHSNSNTTITNYDKGNSFSLSYQGIGESYDFFADESLKYIINHLGEWKFSQMLNNSYEELSYQLSAESFELMIEALLSHPETSEAMIREYPFYDDLGLVNQDTLRINYTYPLRDHYVQLYNTRNFNEKPEILHDINDQNSSDTMSDISSNTTVPNNQTLINSEHTQDNALFNNSNNNQIILLTVLVFGLIIVSSWLINKYYPEKEIKDTVDDTLEYSSVYESLNIWYNYFILFILSMIPVTFSVLYHFRYYMCYRLKLWWLNTRF